MVTQCPHCWVDVSNNATICHSCGGPVGGHPKLSLGAQMRKDWKAMFLLSILTLTIGFLLFIEGEKMTGSDLTGYGSALVLFGIFGMFVSIAGALVVKFESWWTRA